MRVALNVEQLLYRPPGGVGRYTAELARQLTVPHDDSEAVDIVPFVALHRRRAIRNVLRELDLSEVEPVRLVLPRPVLYDLWHQFGVPSLGALARDLRQVDLVHAPFVAIPPRASAPLIVSVHDAATVLFPETYPRRGRRFHDRAYVVAAERADAVIAPSAAAADEISACTPIHRERIRVIHQGVTHRVVSDGLVAATRATLGIGETPYVLWVGTLEPRKNVPMLVDAFRSVVEDPDLPHRLVLVGPRGWLDTDDVVRAHAEGLGDRLLMTGPVRADHLAALYKGADLFAFPSVHEGFGIPVIEAMAQSTAVVCSDIPVFHEIAGDAARFAPPTDADAWGQAMLELLREDDTRARLARAGRQRAEPFTWERCIDLTRELYREVVDAG